MVGGFVAVIVATCTIAAAATNADAAVTIGFVVLVVEVKTKHREDVTTMKSPIK